MNSRPLRAASLCLALLGHSARASLRGNAGGLPSGSVNNESGVLRGSFVLSKRFNLGADPKQEFDVIEIPDENLTHSCANYVDDGSTVFSRGGDLVLKVASHCEGGGCMNSGRIMSKQSFKYGLFMFTARVPKCNYVWPALWLLPADTNGEGNYGRWPCSGEIDVLETVHDGAFGTFNLVAGYGSSGGCVPEETQCNRCIPDYCVSSTMDWTASEDAYFVQNITCDAEHPSWDEHVFVLNWQPDELSMWIDPTLHYDGNHRLVSLTPRSPLGVPKGAQTWKKYSRQETPTWMAVENYMQTCFPERATGSAPFDDGFKIVLNIAVGGYGGSPCYWGEDTCQQECGGAVGSELVVSDISVWELAA